MPDLIRHLSLPGIAGRARNDEPLTVMPDLIRHPSLPGIAGRARNDEGLARNDNPSPAMTNLSPQ